MTNVEPWSTTFKWTRTLGSYSETAWEVQFSQDPSFPPAATEVYTTVDIGVEAPYQVGILESPSLLPNTTYYWRLRAQGGDPTLNCWRPVKKFTTVSTTPVPISPRAVEGDQHPWLLPFTFTKVSGATDYQIQVAYASTLDQGGNPTQLVFGTLTFPASMVGGNVDRGEVEITVPVQQRRLYWRVRARKNSNNATVYSGFERFVTNLPMAQSVAPNGATGLDPWPVAFIFASLKGAEQTWRMVTPLGNFSATKLTGSSYDHNVSGELYYDTITWWMDKPLGPEWGSTLEPVPNREWGAASAPATFSTDGTMTAIDPFDAAFYPQWPACQDSSSQYIEWRAPHPEAAKYKVEVYESQCPNPLPPGGCTLSTQRLVEFFDHVPTADNKQGPIYLDPLLPTSHNDNPGFFWYVRAYTDDDVPGWYSAQGASHINPPAPELVSPAANALVQANNGDIVFTWSSEHAHGGLFTLTVYIGEDCGYADSQFLVQGFSNGTTSTLLHSTDWEPDALSNSGNVNQSWNVAPVAYSPCSGSYISSCRNFTVAAPPPLQPPAIPPLVPSGGYVTLPGNPNDYPFGFAYWGPVSNAEVYEVDAFECLYTTRSLCEGVPAQDVENTQPHFSFYSFADYSWLGQQSTLQSWIRSHFNLLSFTFPGVYYVELQGTDPVAYYFLRFRAKNSAGTSLWSDWYITGPSS